MAVTIEAYYDFRSPYAYFAAHRIREGLFVPPVTVEWRWRPVSIDVLLNLQAGRDPWATYADPLAAPKRAHMLADVRRSAAFYGAPLRPPKPPRPNSIPALCVTALLDADLHDVFRNSIFDALWQQQLDIADPTTLTTCLARVGKDPTILDYAFSAAARAGLADQTKLAYASGIFGVPSFGYEHEVFFGNDRLDMLAWRLGLEAAKS
jgi:2-hydroxychromene-2-carboxylate isomerase